MKTTTNTAANHSILVSVTNTASKYSRNELSINGRINLYGIPYSRKIEEGQSVLIISRNMNKAFYATYKTSIRYRHIFLIEGQYAMPQAVNTINVYNGFKRVECNFNSPEESLSEVIAILKNSRMPQASAHKPTAPAAEAFSSSRVGTHSLPLVRETFKQQYKDLLSLGISSEKIINHLDTLLGHFLIMPVNPALTDTPLSIYSDSRKPHIDHKAILRQIKEKLSDYQYFEFEHLYAKGLRFEGLNAKEAMMKAARAVGDTVFTDWLRSCLHPVTPQPATRDLVKAICLDNFDWTQGSKAA